MDGTFLLTAIFTLLAVIVTAVVFINTRKRQSAAPKADSSQTGRVRTVYKSGSIHLTEKPLQTDTGTLSAKKSKSHHSREDTETSTGLHCKPVCPGDAAAVEPRRTVSMEMTSDPALCPEQEHGTSEEATESSEEACADSLQYVPGLLRISKLEEMMTKEELKVEQRVQQEQLAAIFQLLKENQETFGEVSEGDVEEQLKLYSI